VLTSSNFVGCAGSATRRLRVACAIILANAAAQPPDWYFKFAAGSVSRELKVNRTVKFMRDKFAMIARNVGLSKNTVMDIVRRDAAGHGV
jgi:hypothetical protein